MKWKFIEFCLEYTAVALTSSEEVTALQLDSAINKDSTFFSACTGLTFSVTTEIFTSFEELELALASLRLFRRRKYAGDLRREKGEATGGGGWRDTGGGKAPRSTLKETQVRPFSELKVKVVAYPAQDKNLNLATRLSNSHMEVVIIESW